MPICIRKHIPRNDAASNPSPSAASQGSDLPRRGRYARALSRPQAQQMLCDSGYDFGLGTEGSLGP